jgi:DNA adenine methylase
VFGYGSSFDSDKFWEWCREKAREGHTLYISEYNAPDDFSCIWQKDINSSLSSVKSKKVTEKLFTYAGGVN